ncbi:TonB family protein [Noviherbaspirillum sp.]|uniref:TonB family protein n=1 Tax=Noviherbaspirillum sp. TaxID=1926288 RepID=UPI002D493A7E|nr:TonB family protein [Noviherbaspirillum sp.]HZW22745.1 TonB family protein [Noviherbaspirillum sp.]
MPPPAARKLPPDGPWRLRLAGAVTFSLLVHAFVVSLQFGIPGIALPALELPWRERRAQAVDLSVVLAPPAARPAAEAPALPAEAPASPQAGMRLVPAPSSPKSVPARPAKPRAAARPPRPRAKRETPVIALNERRDDSFNMPAPAVDEILPLPEPQAEVPPAPVAAPESAVAEESKAEVHAPAGEESLQQTREAEERELRRQEEEAGRQQALALEAQRIEEEARRAEAERLARDQEAQRRTEEANRHAEALALQQREREKEAAAAAERQALELEERQRAEALRMQAERIQREAAELQARKLAEAAAAREREQEQKQAAELAARRKAEAEAAHAANSTRGPELVLGDNPAPGARIDALPRGLGGLAGRALEQARRGDALRNDAPTSRQADNSAAPPRRHSLLGSRDADVGVMMYVEGWRLKIERNGSVMFPRAAVDKAHGDPVVTVAVRSDGSVEEVVIHRSSGRPELDEAVHRIVRVNARFSAFPPELARRFDVIEIRRVWNFDDRLRILEEVR